MILMFILAQKAAGKFFNVFIINWMSFFNALFSSRQKLLKKIALQDIQSFGEQRELSAKK